MRKLGTVLLLLATWPLVTAGGGNNPGIPPTSKITGPAISAIVIIDTHNPAVTATAGQGSIRLQKGTLVSGTTFVVNNTVVFDLGCRLSTAGTPLESQGPSLTAVRFLGPLTRFVPADPSGLQGDRLTPLFAQLGITISGTNIPVITDIDNDVCTPSTVAGGVLSFIATIQLQVPH